MVLVIDEKKQVFSWAHNFISLLVVLSVGPDFLRWMVIESFLNG